MSRGAVCGAVFFLCGGGACTDGDIDAWAACATGWKRVRVGVGEVTWERGCVWGVRMFWGGWMRGWGWRRLAAQAAPDVEGGGGWGADAGGTGWKGILAAAWTLGRERTGAGVGRGRDGRDGRMGGWVGPGKGWVWKARVWFSNVLLTDKGRSVSHVCEKGRFYRFLPHTKRTGLK